MSHILLPPSHDSRIPLRLLPLPAHLPPLFSRVPAPLSPSTLYFNIYFALTDVTMFQNIQQFHSGGSNTNSFRLLATLFITKNSIDMRILSTKLSQLKRIAIINAISNCVKSQGTKKGTFFSEER